MVLGAGICGLGTAVLLARDGHRVTVLERDDRPVPDSAEDAWDSWDRRGVAQFRQPHNFMPGLRRILEAELPDVQEGLRRAGAGRFDLLHPIPPFLVDRSPRPGDDALWTYTTRRPAGEWVLADVARNEPRVTVRRGVRAAGPLGGPAEMEGVPHVAGVRTGDGEELRADLVIDAMGRASRSADWLAALGARPPHEEKSDSGFVYHTRYFRGDQPQRAGPVMMHVGTVSILTLPGDNGTWSVTLIASAGDRDLANLRRPETWTKVVRAFPLQAHWLDGEPITDVLTMSGIVDRYRRFAADGRPVVTGLVPVADAWACTNPSAGRGLTVGFLHAVRLRDALREAPDEPLAFARTFDELTERDVAPWYHAQVALDRHRIAGIEALREGRGPPPPADDLTRQILSLLAVMTTDADLFRLALEYLATLTPVQELFRREGVAERVAAAMEAMRDQGPPRMPGPDRGQLLELMA